MRVVKWFLAVIGVLIALAITLPFLLFGYVTIYQTIYRYTHDFRLVLEVKDHGEIRSGSSVIRVSIAPSPEWLRGLDPGSFVTQGEAVVVELSTGRLAVATLRHGPAGNEDRLYSLAARAFGRRGRDWFVEAPWWQGSVELSDNLIPLVVTFADVGNPYSIRAVPPEAFPQVLGPNIHFHRMWLEMTSDPVTRQIEEKLPFLSNRRDDLGARYSSPFLVPTADMFIRGK